jgi:uncharacterized protein (TIGR02466 family)
MENKSENQLSKKLAKIFPTYVIGYDNPQSIEQNLEIIKTLETLEFTPPPSQPYQTIDNHLYNHPALKQFYEWVNMCLEDYRRSFKYSCQSFKIILSWANKANSNGAHRMHVHPNSFLSAIYYISEKSSPTYFEDPRYQVRSGWLVGSPHEMNDSTWCCPSETGSLVIFPSWLPHFTETDPLLADWRYSISMNIIPVGPTNMGSLLELNLR